MTKTITQKVVFKNTTPKALYELYMDAEKHSLVTGDKAIVTPKEGSNFSAFSKYITGKIFQLIKDTLIVQSWRGSDWAKTDMDSTFILNFEAKGKDTIVHMTHVNIPLDQVEGIKSGWDEFYWEPWKKYLSNNSAVKAKKSNSFLKNRGRSRN